MTNDANTIGKYILDIERNMDELKMIGKVWFVVGWGMEGNRSGLGRRRSSIPPFFQKPNHLIYRTFHYSELSLFWPLAIECLLSAVCFLLFEIRISAEQFFGFVLIWNFCYIGNLGQFGKTCKQRRYVLIALHRLLSLTLTLLTGTLFISHGRRGDEVFWLTSLNRPSPEFSIPTISVYMTLMIQVHRNIIKPYP